MHNIKMKRRFPNSKAYCQEMDSWYVSTFRLLTARARFVKVRDKSAVDKKVRCLETGDFYKSRGHMQMARKKSAGVRNNKSGKPLNGIHIAKRYNKKFAQKVKVNGVLHFLLHPESREKIRIAFLFNHSEKKIKKMILKMQKALDNAVLEDGTPLRKAIPYCRGKKRVVEIIKDCARENCIGVSNGKE